MIIYFVTISFFLVLRLRTASGDITLSLCEKTGTDIKQNLALITEILTENERFFFPYSSACISEIFLAQCLSFTSPYDNCHKTTDFIRGSCVTVEKSLAD